MKIYLMIGGITRKKGIIKGLKYAKIFIFRASYRMNNRRKRMTMK